jgi:hypothetical protein
VYLGVGACLAQVCSTAEKLDLALFTQLFGKQNHYSPHIRVNIAPTSLALATNAQVRQAPRDSNSEANIPTQEYLKFKAQNNHKNQSFGR